MNRAHSQDRAREFPVTDDDLDAPDGAVVDGYERVGHWWYDRMDAAASSRICPHAGDRNHPIGAGMFVCFECFMRLFHGARR